MLITSLELIGYKRIALNGRTRITIRPTERIQLILGTNGSGKSSLMKELTPLPAEPKEYTKDGSKTITITHRGSTYVLKSWFAEGNKHSFIKNGNEINDGHTITVQRKLVQTEFGVTDDIHELLRNLVRFHSMGPTDRRKWFTMLSDVDYTYAIGVYMRLKEAASGSTHALKLAKNKLVSETGKLTTEEEERKLAKEVEQLYVEIEQLQRQRAPLPRPVSSFMTEQEELLDDLYTISNNLLRHRAAFFGWKGYDSVEQISEDIDLTKQDIAATQALLAKSVEEHGKLSEKHELLKKTGAQGVEALLRRLHQAQVKRNAVLSQRTLGLEGFHPVSANNALESIFELLFATFSAIPQNDDRRFSQTKNNETKAKILERKDVILLKQKEINFYSGKKQHMESHKDDGNVECPNCHHLWKIGYDPEVIKKYETAITERTDEITKVQAEIKLLEDEVEGFVQYVNLYVDFSRCVKNWPALQPFWDYLLDEEMVVRAPRIALMKLDQLKKDLQFELEAYKHDDEIAEIKELIKQAEQLGDANLNEVTERLVETTKVVEDLTLKLQRLNSYLNSKVAYRRQMSDVQETGKKIEGLIDKAEDCTKELIEMIRREAIQNCINALQLSLARKSEALQEMKLQKGIIAELENTIRQYALREQTLKLMVKEMSPTDGLIAEGLLGFIRRFVKQMNQLIKKIWAYPLEIQPCGIATDRGAELDYKFPLMVQSRANIVDDVKNGSSGMQEVVDLAFKVVAMQYLGLGEAPLILDEFGASFDLEHRTSASACIKNLMDTQGFSQLFMISHYESGYGSFTNAQTCVLDAKNITVPAKYNEHVTIY
jgi:energy-coupling factor transporter ATP-binding protein EcfA2